MFRRHGLTRVLSYNDRSDFYVVIRLLFKVYHVRRHRRNGRRSLIASYRVVRGFLTFFSLLFRVVKSGNEGVIILILLPLPVHSVNFRAGRAIFRLLRNFVYKGKSGIGKRRRVPIRLAGLHSRAILSVYHVLSRGGRAPVSIARSRTITLGFGNVETSGVLRVIAFPRHLNGVRIRHYFFSYAMRIIRSARLITYIRFRAFQPRAIGINSGIDARANRMISNFLSVLLTSECNCVLVLCSKVDPYHLVRGRFIMFLTMLVRAIVDR